MRLFPQARFPRRHGALVRSRGGLFPIDRIVGNRFRMALMAVCISFPVYAQTYKCVDSNLRTYYQDKACESGIITEQLTDQGKAQKPTERPSGLANHSRQSNLLSVKDRLNSCEEATAIAAAEEVMRASDVLNKAELLFYASLILYRNDRRDEALFWYNAAKLRGRYQAVFEPTQAGQLLTVMELTLGPFINNYALQDASKFSRILDQVLEWDKKTSNPFREISASETTEKQVNEIYAGIKKMKAKLAAEGPAMERKARSAAPRIEASFDELLDINRTCRKTAQVANLPAKPSDEDNRSLESFTRTIDRSKYVFFAIYFDRLKIKPDLSGRVVFRLVVNPEGQVIQNTVVSSTLRDGHTEDAVKDAILNLKFGKAKRSDDIVFTYPIEFTPK